MAAEPRLLEASAELSSAKAAPQPVSALGATAEWEAAIHGASRPPNPISRWWSRSLAAIGSDLALHGLAYVGVLLLFVGSFGLVAFAFGDVARNLRPVAEIALALVPFAAARLLLARGAVVAGRAVELAGGLLLPIMIITSFLDGVGLPPDLAGPALVVALTAAVGAIAVGYAAWAAGHPGSALRFLVAPTAWLAVGLATVGVGRPIPSGSGVASITAAQVGAVAGAMVLSAAAARRRPDAQLADPTLTVSLVGAPIVGLLAVLTWAAESFPPVPVAVTGVLGLALVELLSARLGPDRTSVFQTSWWVLAWLGLAGSPDVDPAHVAVVALFGFVVLLEGASTRKTNPWLLGMPAALAVCALGVSWQDPWSAVATTTAAAVWAIARRTARVPMVEVVPLVFDVAAGTLPAVAIVALWRATDDAVTALAVAAALVLVSTVPATRPVLRRSPDDAFWPRFWGVGMVLVAAAAAAVWFEAYPATQAAQWLIAGAVAVLALSSALGPIASAVRPWPTAALCGWAWLLACQAGGAPADMRALVISVAALALVIAGNVAEGPKAEIAGNLALAGHALGAAALALPSSDWGLTAMVALATSGWLVTSWYDLRDRSPVGSLLAGLSPLLRLAPPAIAGLGVPLTAALALDASGVLVWWSAWWPIVPAATAVVYAAATRLPLNGRTTTALAWVAVGASLLAPVVASETWPAATALAGLVACVILMAPARRPRFMVWVGWAALAPLAGLVAVGTSDRFGALPRAQSASVTLVAVGATMLLLAAGGVRGRSWQPRRRRPDPSALPPLLIGAAEVVAGLVLAWMAVPNPLAGWLTVAAAVVALGIGLLSRVGILVAASAGLGWLAALMLAKPWIEGHVWIGVVVAAALLLGCEADNRLLADRRWWARWDLGLFIVAHVTTLTSLILTAPNEVLDALGMTDVATSQEEALTRVAAGLLSVGIAIRLRARAGLAVAYACAGVLLVGNASSNSGPGWYALMLAALSIALTVLAGRVQGRARVVCQFGGALAALGAWVELADWLDWTDESTLRGTALVASLAALGVVGALRAGSVDRSWAVSWGSVAGLTTAITTSAALLSSRSDIDPSPVTVLALLILAAAMAAAATPLDTAWLRDLAAASLLTAELHALVLWDATPGGQVGVLSTTSLLCALVLLLTRNGPPKTWQRPMLLLGIIASIAAVAIGLGQLPDSTLLVPGLLVGAVQAAAIGVVFASLAALAVAPVLACAAWLVYAKDALGGNPQWYAVPLGLALLVVVALARQDRRQRGLDPAGRGIVIVELVGIGVIVGPSLVQSITESLGYTLLAAGFGLGIIGWGAVSRVRRRVACGAAVVVVAIVELVAVPMAQLLPAWSGAGMWVLIIVVGLAALSAATVLEWARTTVRRAVLGFSELTEGWE